MSEQEGKQKEKTSAEMAEELSQTLKQLEEAKKLVETKDKEARINQRRADKAERTRLPLMGAKSQSESATKEEDKTDPALTRMQELEAAANQAERDRLILRELMSRGLTEADLEDLPVDVDELQSPAELRLAFDNLQMKRQLHQVTETLKDRKQETTPAGGSGTQVDTGGQRAQPTSGLEEGPSVEELRKAAVQLGRTPEGRYAMLAAIHLDPSKIIPE